MRYKNVFPLGSFFALLISFGFENAFCIKSNNVSDALLYNDYPLFLQKLVEVEDLLTF